MKTIKVVIKGISDLLMNSPKSMLEPEEKTKDRLKKRNREEEAEKLAYRMKSGELYVPKEAIYGCLINASSYKKFGRYSLKPIIAGAISVEPMEIGLGTKNYEIDLRTVVIQNARVPKARPKIKKGWELKFDIIYNEDMIEPKVIRQCLEEGGQRVGLLDYNPIHFGPFGRFEVKDWKVQK